MRANRPALHLVTRPPGGQGPPPAKTNHSHQLVIVAMARLGDTVPAALVRRLREQGFTLYVTHGSDGCLRAATSLAPDMLYIDPRLPARLTRQVQAHPGTTQTDVRWLPISV